MAEAVVSFVVQRLGDLLIQETVLFYGVHQQIERLQTELRRIQCFLKDADEKQEEDQRVRNWVTQIREIAYDSEDVIDTFILKVLSRRNEGLFKRSVSKFNKWLDQRKVGKEIEGIQARLRDISVSRETYGIRNIGEGGSSSSSSTHERQRLLRQSYPHAEDEDIVGLEKDTESLVAELTKEEEQRRVVSIVGMGGLGKTTLAKKVYNHKDVQSHFEYCVWVYVSEECVWRDIMQEILRKVSSPNNQEMEIIVRMKEAELVEKLHTFLDRKKYLVVLDDIWSTEAWDILSSAFPNGSKGSKVLLTTRNNEVASRADPWSLHLQPGCLTNEESLELLLKKAFPKNMHTRSSPSLESCGRELVAKCGGLPLAVVALGGLLATKKTLNEWKIVGRNMAKHWNKGQHGVLGMLALSYNDLPYHLKPCFLYLGIFPEDSDIPTEKLIRLWIAEGFIPQEGEETTEEIAEEHITELIHRCMVQVGKRSLDGRIKTCRLHDLMRDLCKCKAKEENFYDNLHATKAAHSDSSSSSSSIAPAGKLRRRAIHCEYDRYVSMEKSTPHLRTLLFNPENSRHVRHKFIYQDFILLRILELEGVRVVESLPSEIGDLVHLRYLGLRGTCMRELPQSIGNLQSLQTLDLRNCVSVFVSSLGKPGGDRVPLVIPNVIWKMQQLRHFYVTSNMYCPTGHLEVNNLWNLQTLHCIQAGRWIEKDLTVFANLRKLGIEKVSRSQVEIVLNSILSGPNSIQSLKLRLDGGEIFPDLEPLSRCHHLLRLHLKGSIKKLRCPENITKLALYNSGLLQDSLAMLQNLPNLMCLKLKSSADQESEIVFLANGFPRLQFLDLGPSDKLEELKVEEGALPNLKHLKIEGCNKLRMLPDGLRFLTKIRILEIIRMPLEFDERIREGGEDRYKVQHIPSVVGLVQRRFS